MVATEQQRTLGVASTSSDGLVMIQIGRELVALTPEQGRSAMLFLACAICAAERDGSNGHAQ